MGKKILGIILVIMAVLGLNACSTVNVEDEKYGNSENKSEDFLIEKEAIENINEKEVTRDKEETFENEFDIIYEAEDLI